VKAQKIEDGLILDGVDDDLGDKFKHTASIKEKGRK
jgi:hypothetical protein